MFIFVIYSWNPRLPVEFQIFPKTSMFKGFLKNFESISSTRLNSHNEILSLFLNNNLYMLIILKGIEPLPLNFPIPISLQPKVLDLNYFKL